MSMSTSYWAWSYPNITSIQKLVLMAMADACSGLDPFSTANPEWIFEEINCSDCTISTIRETLSELENLNVIKNVSDDLEVIRYFDDFGMERDIFWEFIGYTPSNLQFKRSGK